MRNFSFSDLQVSDDSCFLCGAKDASLTQEHVFPKWLQRRYNLLTNRLDLLNRTSIQYKSIKIPCCDKCNNEDLSKLEKTIQTAVSGGFEQLSKLDPYLIYLWVGKIYYGLLRLEIACLQDQSKPDDGAILPKETLESFSALHLFLQAIRGKHKFSENPPYSVLICNLHDVGAPRNFSFQDSFLYMTCGMRLGNVGIIVALEDTRLTEKSFGRYLEKVAGRKLHPIQFDELYAKVLYQVSLLEGRAKYVTSKHISDLQTAHTLVLDDGYLNEWSQEAYSKVLGPMVSKWLRSDPEKTVWFVPPNLVPTWMTDKDGELLLLPLADWAQLSDA